MKTATPKNSPKTGWQSSLLVVLVVASVWAVCLRNPVVWRSTGIGETSVPFLDLYALLAAGEVAQAGGDPFQPNPLDPYNRPHVYTTWWLGMGAIGLTRADTKWLGQALAGLCLVAAVFLIRPKRLDESIQAILVLCSPGMLMAVNRGNNDLVVFVIVCAALGCLRSNALSFRALGVTLLAISAALKYYPLAALVVLLAARSRREWSGALILYALVLILAWPALRPGLESAVRYQPRPEWLYAFGAPILFRDFGFHPQSGWLIPTFIVSGWVAWRARRLWMAAPSGRWASSEEREFICGAALIVGCFFLGASYVYKLIFAVWLLPWFWRGHHSIAKICWARIIWWLLLAVLWLEGLLALVINLVISGLAPAIAHRMLVATLVASQLLTWGLIVCLLRPLVAYGVERSREIFQAESRAPTVP
jgi:hypothetical protein